MPSLTVWIYDTPLGAEAGQVRLRRLLAAEALHVFDAVTVTWVPGSHEPRIRQMPHTSFPSERDSVLTALVKLLPSQPALDDIAVRLRGTGIDPEFLEDVGEHLGQGTSALWVLSGDVDLDLVRPVVEHALARGDVILRHARLTDEAPDALAGMVDDLASGLRPNR